MLIGLVAVATLRNRGGGEVDPLDDTFEVDTAHDTAAEAEALRLAGSDDLGRARLSDSFRRPSGSAPFGLGGGEHDPFEPARDDSDDFSELEPEADDSDTAPTRIPSDADPPSGRHAAIQLDEPQADVHEPVAAAPPEERSDPRDAPEPQTAIHLPLADPYLPPTGYPIKADTKSGCTGRRRRAL